MSGSRTRLDASALLLFCGPESAVLSRTGVEGYAGPKRRYEKQIPHRRSRGNVLRPLIAGKRGTGFGMTSPGVVTPESVALFVVRNIAST